MVIALMSSLAFALAFGPHVQATLQAAQDDAIVDSAPDTAIVDAASPETVSVPSPRQTDLGADRDAPSLEEIEETVIAPQEIAEPIQDSSEPGEDTPANQVDPANDPAGSVPAADWPALLSDISAALAAAKTATGEFVQTNADGSVSTGSFALNRPGRIRFDYDDPTPILIVSDGATVAMQDRELETVDRVPLRSTPLGLILSTELDVDQDTEVLGIQQNADQFRYSGQRCQRRARRDADNGLRQDKSGFAGMADCGQQFANHCGRPDECQNQSTRRPAPVSPERR